MTNREQIEFHDTLVSRIKNRIGVDQDIDIELPKEYRNICVYVCKKNGVSSKLITEEYGLTPQRIAGIMNMKHIEAIIKVSDILEDTLEN